MSKLCVDKIRVIIVGSYFTSPAEARWRSSKVFWTMFKLGFWGPLDFTFTLYKAREDEPPLTWKCTSEFGPKTSGSVEHTSITSLQAHWKDRRWTNLLVPYVYLSIELATSRILFQNAVCYYHVQQLQSSFDLVPPSFPCTYTCIADSIVKRDLTFRKLGQINLVQIKIKTSLLWLKIAHWRERKTIAHDYHRTSTYMWGNW